MNNKRIKEHHSPIAAFFWQIFLELPQSDRSSRNLRAVWELFITEWENHCSELWALHTGGSTRQWTAATA